MRLANEEIVISVAYSSTAPHGAALFKGSQGGSWVVSLRSRKPRLVVAVALANKTARVAWAVMSRQDTYRRIAVAA